MRPDKIPTEWTPIAIRDRWPPQPFPADFKVEHLWRPLNRAIMTVDQAHDAYLDGKIFKATHFTRDTIFCVIKRRMKAPKITPRAEQRMRNEIRQKRVA